jgi:tricorn protease
MKGSVHTSCLRTLLIVILACNCVDAFAREFASGGSQGPLLLRDPSLSNTHVAFTYAGDIWIANRDGSSLRRLTNTGRAAKPAFSPDGSQIAFIGQYDGVRNVYAAPLAGGEPRRLTFHPADLGEMRMSRTGDMVGWTPDGKRILFSSRRAAFAGGVVQLFTLPAEGGPVDQAPLVRAAQGSLSPDGARIAYVANIQWQPEWKRYRGGQTTSIWIAKIADSSVEARIPRENSNDFNPMWVGEHIYFLSDRSGPVTLFSYDLKSGEVKQLVKNEGFDLKSAAASKDAIVYEQFGSLHLLDLKSGQVRFLDIRPVADLPEIRPHVRNVAEVIESSDRTIKARLSPSGDRVAFGLRGDILVAGAKKSHVRNVTRTTGAVEREPAWSPDGRAIAYFSDESGEYALHVRNVSGRGAVRKISLGDPASFYYSPIWSPDSSKVGYTDKRLNYWYVDVKRSTPVRVDTDLFVNPAHSLQFAWSPDSRWFAYTKQLSSRLHAVFIHSVEQGKSYQLTDGMSDTRHVAFDDAGQYLYFTASIDASMKTGLLNIPTVLRPVARNVYALMLKETLPLLTVAQSAGKDTRCSETAEAIRTCIDRMAKHILTLPVPARNYDGLSVGKPGAVFLVERAQISDPLVFSVGNPIRNIYKFDLTTRKTELILEEVTAFELSFDREQMLYARQNTANQNPWFVSSVDAAIGKSREPRRRRQLKLDAMQIYVDPRVEWRHMFEQVWRNQRDFFYDPGLHGLDREEIKKRYEPFLENLASRDDLDYLFNEMLGNVSVDHMSVAGPQASAFRLRRSRTGLLGADYCVKDNRYCFARIYERDTWNPQSRAPLREPGMNVEVGEYLLAVNGRDVFPSADIYKYFEGTAGKPVVLTVGPKPDGSDSRDITVVPLDDEAALRNYAWIENNRRKVDELTNGRVAYVYLPDVSALGYRNFNRYYFAQAGKGAVIIDERYNAGGILADYFIDYLRRPLLNFFHLREGQDISTPMEGIFGPKVMIINEIAGSGGDHLPWLFRKAGLGPLIGKRTWGGLVGGAVNPDDLLDGGRVNTPNLAFYNTDGAWEIENHSAPPDIEVEENPHAARMGHDVQLEKAVEVVLELLRKNPAPSAPQHPPYRLQ